MHVRESLRGRMGSTCHAWHAGLAVVAMQEPSRAGVAQTPQCCAHAQGVTRLAASGSDASNRRARTIHVHLCEQDDTETERKREAERDRERRRQRR
eukprot:9798643-Alexandrium_andersonii.AAC.1